MPVLLIILSSNHFIDLFLFLHTPIMRYGGSADYKVNALRAHVTIVWLAVGNVLIQFRFLFGLKELVP